MRTLKAEKRHIKREKAKQRMASLSDQLKRRQPTLKTKRLRLVKK